MNAKPEPDVLVDDPSRKRRIKNALDARLERWAEWSLSGSPLADLGLPRRSTLAGIYELRLTEAANSGQHTAHARQSTVPMGMREEQCQEEEQTEAAIYELSKYDLLHALIIRAEYLWIVPVPNDQTGQYIPRRVMRKYQENVSSHRQRMAQLLNRSLQRYLQLLEASRVALAVLIEHTDNGWISSAASKSN